MSGKVDYLPDWKLTHKSDHYQPCLNTLCAKYNDKYKPVLLEKQ